MGMSGSGSMMWGEFWASFMLSWGLIGVTAVVVFALLAMLVWWLDGLERQEFDVDMPLIGVKGGSTEGTVEIPKPNGWQEIEQEDLHHRKI
jgi:hypothetical protein